MPKAYAFTLFIFNQSFYAGNMDVFKYLHRIQIKIDKINF